MLSTLETLPDEILMMIFSCSDDVITTLRAFLGLNQRFNRILLDKHLHLLSDYLHTNIHDDYYKSEVFHQVSQQLLSVNKSIDTNHLCQVLQPLINYHIQQKYLQSGRELQSSFEQCQLMRQQLTDEEISQIDNELNEQFHSLKNISITREHIRYIKSLVLSKGACLQCDDDEFSEYNITKCVYERLLQYINSPTSEASNRINLSLQLFKILIISNPSLLKNRDHIANQPGHLQKVLLHNIFRLKPSSHNISSEPVNMEYYRAIVDLSLFTIQSWKYVPDQIYYIEDNMFDVLGMISEVDQDTFIRNAQWEILGAIINDYFLNSYEAWDDQFKNTLKEIFKKLIEKKRLDVIKYIYFYFRFEDFFNDSKYVRECINLMTGNRSDRRFFSMIMDDASLDSLFFKKTLLFILLQKKERKLIEKILMLSPNLIDELDENGNDPLLYICLRVNGCRHRIIEFLINMGSDLQRKNNDGQNFLNALQLPRNKKLLEVLYEQEIISEYFQ
ncbi:unnamed protein product [Adineta ricciae]|uniref:F-box domain-containing protein n=1 Tax=Adineta ricciae TaxID=249248 RepID=A0A813ZEP2_ADIRI|nr:unnamed protein product [Adineta ricciae]CAF1272278.1 unnamed protein product [Adineta ricciae]